MEQYTKQLINGQWKNGSSDKEVIDKNPFTGETLLTIPSANKNDLDEAYKAAEKTQQEWALTTPAEKQKLFTRLIQIMQEQKEEILDWLIKESGSTRIKANLEFQSSLSIITESASFPTRMAGTILPSNYPNKENRVYRHPKGVIGIIGPWNFPLHLTMRSAAPAIAAGNSVVIKPASDTPVTSGLLVGKLFQDAGFPDGLVNVCVGRGSEIGDAFVEHPVPKLISFTGSTEVGKGIGEKAGKHIKETALELGGNNAMLVLKDANIEEAAKAAVFGKFFHQGQICMALNRIIVDKEVYDEFVHAFVSHTSKLKAGNPADKDTFIGPLINQNAVERIQKDLEESVKQGAEIVLNGSVKGMLMEPIVLTQVTNDMPITKNEIFGPVAPIIKAEDEEDAIKIANDSPNGLSGSVFTQDLHRGAEIAKRIVTGMIHVNDQSVNDEAHVPFGGEKESGIGRFNGEWALEKFTNVKWIGIQNGYREFPII